MGLRLEHPDATAREIEVLLRRRLERQRRASLAAYRRNA
jgi:hypothetical protein